jgi:hypothetical protein
MNSYEDKQEARRERLKARADRLQAAASAAFKRADLSEEATGIPFGQPILVGHHSERRHRATIARAERAMRKGVDLAKQAEGAAARASSVGTGGISSDDPDAIQKLKAELTQLEARIIAENAANKALRKGDWGGVAAAVGQQRADREKAFFDRWGYAGFHVANRRANARRIKARIEQLQAMAKRKDKEEEAEGGLRVVENAEANRLQLFFPGRPPSTVVAALKSGGWRWAPSEGAWQRHLNNGARYAVEAIRGVWAHTLSV